MTQEVKGYIYQGENFELPAGRKTSKEAMLSALQQKFPALRDSSSFTATIDAEGFLVIQNNTGSKA